MALALLFTSCIEDDWDDIIIYPDSQTGLFVVNSGVFPTGTSSLSYYDLDANVVYNGVIDGANPGLQYWGDVAQSMVVRKGLGYIVVNNSGKVLIVDVNNYRVVGKIVGLTSPRYMHFLSDNKAYITDLYGRAISVVNPQAIFTNDKRETTPYAFIDVDNGQQFNQHSTERMVQWGHLVFVSCWMRDRQILVIDSNTDAVVDSITVAAQPNSLLIDKYNKLWVLCDGGYDGNPYAYEHPRIQRIDLNTLRIEHELLFSLDNNPTELVINAAKDTLFYLDRDVYKLPALSNDTPQPWILSHSSHSGYGKGFYSLAIDPANADFYIGDALDNNQPGYVYRFSQSGSPLDTFKVGINPVGFCFK